MIDCLFKKLSFNVILKIPCDHVVLKAWLELHVHKLYLVFSLSLMNLCNQTRSQVDIKLCHTNLQRFQPRVIYRFICLDHKVLIVNNLELEKLFISDLTQQSPSLFLFALLLCYLLFLGRRFFIVLKLTLSAALPNLCLIALAD
jgi:hypothetical protein